MLFMADIAATSENTFAATVADDNTTRVVNMRRLKRRSRIERSNCCIYRDIFVWQTFNCLLEHSLSNTPRASSLGS